MAAPVVSASIFATATSRESGTMPQFVLGMMCSGATCFIASRIVCATSCGVSIRSVATSITPTITSLPFSIDSTRRGTRDPAHSRDT